MSRPTLAHPGDLRAAALTVVLMGGVFAGCATVDEQHSPHQQGIELRAAPAIQLEGRTTTVHPTVAVSRSIAGGVDGETDTKLFLGGQVRFRPSGGGDVWFGGEAAFARRWTSFDDDALDTEGTNGWTFAGLAGRPFAETSLGTWHVYAAAGVNKYGGTGFYGRIGIDLQR